METADVHTDSFYRDRSPDDTPILDHGHKAFKTKSDMHYLAEAAIRSVGEYTRFQLLFLLMSCCLTSLPDVFFTMEFVFIGHRPERKICNADSSTINSSRPMAFDALANTSSELQAPINHYTEAINAFLKEHGPTLATEFNLICLGSYLIPLSQTVLGVSSAVGAIVVAPISDRIGRKPVCLTLAIISSLIGWLSSFVKTMTEFIFTRALLGLSLGGLAAGLMYSVELFPTKHRPIGGAAISIFWAVGPVLISFVAYVVKDWRTLQTVLSIVLLVMALASVFMMPESLIWLIDQRKYSEARKVLEKAWQMNGHFENLSESRLYIINLLHEADRAKNDCAVKSEDKVNYATQLLLLLKYKRMALIMLIVILLRFIAPMINYAVSFSSSSLSGNIYLNFSLISVVEVLPQILVIPLVFRFGRKRPCTICLILSSVILLSMTLLSQHDFYIIQVIIYLVAKCTINISYTIIFMFSLELFPTSVRVLCFVFGTFALRLGMYGAAPYYNDLAETVWWLPGSVCAFMSAVAAFLVLYLPETKGRPLPTSVEQVINWR